MKKTKKAIIFGTAGAAEVCKYLLDTDSEYEVVAFTASSQYIESDTIYGLPLVPFEGIETRYSPAEYEMYISVGYVKSNTIRERFYTEAKQKGYKLLTYISSRCTCLTDKIGDNTFIFEDNTIQPFVTIGSNVVLWSGNHIGHHSVIEDNCFISSHVVVSGHCRVGANSFVGVNTTMRDSISIGKFNIIGAGALLVKSTEDYDIYIGVKASFYKKNDLS